MKTKFRERCLKCCPVIRRLNFAPPTHQTIEDKWIAFYTNNSYSMLEVVLQTTKFFLPSCAKVCAIWVILAKFLLYNVSVGFNILLTRKMTKVGD
jgi:hypothetical protein